MTNIEFDKRIKALKIGLKELEFRAIKRIKRYDELKTIYFQRKEITCTQ